MSLFSFVRLRMLLIDSLIIYATTRFFFLKLWYYIYISWANLDFLGLTIIFCGISRIILLQSCNFPHMKQCDAPHSTLSSDRFTYTNEELHCLSMSFAKHGWQELESLLVQVDGCNAYQKLMIDGKDQSNLFLAVARRQSHVR